MINNINNPSSGTNNNSKKVVIMIDMSSEDCRQIIRKEAELESQNKYIRELSQELNQVNEEVGEKSN